MDIEYMKQSGRLQLTKRQMLMHFFWGLFLLILMVVLFVALVGKMDQKALAYLTAILAALACLYILRQLGSLRFHAIPASMNDEEFREMFDAISKEQAWIMEFNTQDCIIATTEFRWTNWGTMITLIRDKDRILVNSICDLYQRPSTISWGQNRKNVEAVKRYIGKRSSTVKRS